MPDTVNAAKQTGGDSSGLPLPECVAAAKTAGAKFWTSLRDNSDNVYCNFYDELIPKPSDDKSITGSTACSDLYKQLEQGGGGFGGTGAGAGRKKKRNTNALTTANILTTEIPITTGIPTTIPNQSSNPNQSNPAVPKLTRPPNIDVYLNPLKKISGVLQLCFPNVVLIRNLWETVDCAEIFTPLPTDYGMCCAFNPRSILRWQNF